MKKLSKIFFGLGIVSVSLFSCDTIDSEVVKNFGKDTSNVTDTSVAEQRIRKVLIEDFTGHKCPNCPQAAIKLEELKSIYGEKIIPIAVHVTYEFAAQDLPKYPGNFRTNEGTELDAFFKISNAGLPKGMVNRVGYPSSEHIISYSEWGAEAAAILAKAPDISLKIDNTFEISINQVTSVIKTEFLNDLSGEYKLCVYLIQDSIISPQLDGSVGAIIPDYVHMHMLRKALNGNAFGETIANNPVASSTPISRTYNLVLLPEWIPKNCHIVAFVYNAVTYEIIQAEQKLVK